MESRTTSFSSFRSYLHALSDTPNRLARRAASVSTSFEETSRIRARSGQDMKKSLRWYDLVGFGLGGMVGAGVFVTSGTASTKYAGPSVILSYAIAGICALLSAFCYTEFAVDMPVAGGAFSYIRVTFGSYCISYVSPSVSTFCFVFTLFLAFFFNFFYFGFFAGEFLAFLTGANLIIDYVLSNAAVARSFTTYFATAIGVSTETHLRITVHSLPKGLNEIDFVAVALVLILTVLICYR